MGIPGGEAISKALRAVLSRTAEERLAGLLERLAQVESGRTVRDDYTDRFPRVRIAGDDAVSLVSLSGNAGSRVRLGVVCRSLLPDEEQWDFPAVELHPAWQSRDAAVPWMRPVMTGDPVLDARFAVFSEQGRSVGHVFTPSVRDGLLSVHYLLDLPGVRLTLGGRLLALRKTATAEQLTVPVLQDLLARTRRLHDSLLEIFRVAAEPGVHFLERRHDEVESRCRVCGEPLDAQPVFCVACETPHHSDCWQYLGRCAIFACGAQAFFAGAKRGPEAEERRRRWRPRGR